MRIKTFDDLGKFQSAALIYFEHNPGLTWKQFCEGLKDFNNVDL